jgi:Oxidoreductase family, C-terminal alpha/beta domain
LITGDEGGLVRRNPNTVGDLFYGADGWMAIDGAGFTIFRGEKGEKVLEEKADRASDTGLHMKNFLDCVRSRDYKKLNAEVEIGVMSAAMCHMANISYRLGRRLDFDPVTWRFKDSDANKYLTREYRKPYVVPASV